MEKDRWLYKEFALLDEALAWARHSGESGRVALLVEGDDGTRLDKSQIAAAGLIHNEMFPGDRSPARSVTEVHLRDGNDGR